MKFRLLLASLIITSSFNLHAQDNLLWKFETGNRVYSTPLVQGNMVYAGSGDHHIYALDRNNGAVIWKFVTGGAVHSSPSIHNDLVYAGSDDGNLYALDRKTGELAWKFASGGEKMYDLWDYYRSSPVVEDGLVYWGSGDGHVYALEAATGSLVWKYQTGDIVHASPVVKNDTVYIGSFDGFFYALNAENGELVWKFNTVGAQYFPKGEVQKAALVDNDAVYFGTRDYNMYALDAKTGRGWWNMRQIRGWIIATPVEYEGRLYFGTSDAHLFYCLDKLSGEIVWTIPVPMRVYGAAVVHKGMVYFGCFDGKVFGVDPMTGETKWEFQTDASKSGYPGIFKEDGHFRDDFELYGADYLESEKRIHSLGSILSSMVVSEDILYFGSSDGCLYAVRLP